MSANDFAYATTPQATDHPYKNTDVVDFVQGNVVKLDASNPISGTQPIAGALLAGNNDYPCGVVMETIKQGQSGRVRRVGDAQVVAGAAITAGAIVQSSGSGKVGTQNAGQPQLGQAKTAAAANLDRILVELSIAKNA